MDESQEVKTPEKKEMTSVCTMVEKDIDTINCGIKQRMQKVSHIPLDNRRRLIVRRFYENEHTWYEGRGKHMKIEFCQENQQYYLHDGRMFDSIIELVNFYRANNLSEGFNNLDVTLKGTPLKGNIYRALHDYKGSTPFKYLSMAKGDL
uniref:SH2 domain-containing protein n=1 Tax=Ditylenchus dipsaci TaxID=166011 RepID=A0A915DIR0_9BILA